MKNYILDGHVVVEAGSGAWREFMERGIDARRVAWTDLDGGVSVSTVFLGLDHAWGGGPPLLFETMVFEGPTDQWMDRYYTWDQAEAGHQRVVAKLLAGESLDDDSAGAA